MHLKPALSRGERKLRAIEKALSVNVVLIRHLFVAVHHHLTTSPEYSLHIRGRVGTKSPVHLVTIPFQDCCFQTDGLNCSLLNMHINQCILLPLNVHTLELSVTHTHHMTRLKSVVATASLSVEEVVAWQEDSGRYNWETVLPSHTGKFVVCLALCGQSIAEELVKTPTDFVRLRLVPVGKYSIQSGTCVPNKHHQQAVVAAMRFVQEQECGRLFENRMGGGL
eukprot:TRINITY_DN46208_c0_g1_i1.p1 TRINITY_DN46208_c0_g1~~TRINITY_DN46208_c0_g1_i1.p1  ORF type:complete len:223 (-),score=6.34 TRINITY_DN46208_c0_g1_i1:91-759(-)